MTIPLKEMDMQIWEENAEVLFHRKTSILADYEITMLFKYEEDPTPMKKQWYTNLSF